jgi:uncharacterized protein
MDDKQTYIVNRLKDILIDRYNPELIILYGSTARGDTDEFSDIDIMVIMDVDDGEKTTTEMLAGTDHIVQDKHIMLRSCNDFYSQKDIPGTMIYSALREGVILFTRSGFETDALHLKNYEDRKRDVIEKEYLEQAHEFFANGEQALENRQLFRCRDYLKFAVVRAIKAVLVLRDVHPPRGTDLEELFRVARGLLPEVGKLQPLIQELDSYLPGGNNPEEVVRCRELVDKIEFLVDSIDELVK